MKLTTRRAVLLVEEGAAFLELEGRLMTPPRKDDAMNDRTPRTAEQQFAPVEAWDAIAAGFDTHVAPGEAPLAEAALRLAGLEAGHRFLDVAAGTGGLSLPAARLGASVIATDWSPKMIERFNRRVREERLEDAEGRIMDCHALAFDDDTFDVTGSQFGVMLVPDQAQALREMVRVTRRGGRVLLIAYGSQARFEALQLFVAGLRSVAPSFAGLPADPPPLEFQVSDPQVLHRRLVEAGLADVRVDTTHQERIDIDSGQALWDWCLGSNPIPGQLVADLSEAQRSAMRSHIDELIRARADHRGIAVISAALNIGVGTKRQ